MAAAFVDEIVQAFAERGGEAYGEDVTQLEHALQCALLAAEDGAGERGRDRRPCCTTMAICSKAAAMWRRTSGAMLGTRSTARGRCGVGSGRRWSGPSPCTSWPSAICALSSPSTRRGSALRQCLA